MSKIKNKMLEQPLDGNEFADTVGHLHSMVCTDYTAETEPYHMPILVREYLIYAIAVHEGCQACSVSHARRIRQLEKDCVQPLRDFKDILESLTLFMEVEKDNVSDVLWKRWLIKWNRYTNCIDRIHPHFSKKLALLVALWDSNETLKELMYESLLKAVDDYDEYEGVLADIHRIHIFMKASTAKYENEATMKKMLKKARNFLE